MASTTKGCKYHPDIPARWHCPDCAIHFCSRCVPPNERGQAFCPVCDRMLEKQEFSATIPPYWKRMPAAFLYPLRPASLSYLAIVSLACPLFVFLGGPLIGGILSLVLLPFILMKYAFQSLQSTAVGHMKPTIGSTTMHGKDFVLTLKLLLVIIITSFLLGLLGIVGKIGVVIATVLSALVLPAQIMQLGISRSALRALNPAQLIETIRVIGPSYLGLIGIQFMINGASVFLPRLIAPLFLPHHILIFLGLFVFSFSYYTILLYHLMGYVIYQYHEDLGVKAEVEYEPQSKGKKASEPVGVSPLSKAQLLVQEGHPEVAKPFVAKHLSHELTAEQLQLRELYIKLLKQLGENEELVEKGKVFIADLMAHGHGEKKALQIFALCHEADPGFQLESAEHTHALMQAAQKASDFSLMLALAKDFAKRHPGYPNIFDIYLSVARVLHEQFKRDQQAASILQSLIAKFPQHEGIQQARLALARIERAQQGA